MKQYMPMKNTKRGIKLWLLAPVFSTERTYRSSRGRSLRVSPTSWSTRRPWLHAGWTPKRSWSLVTVTRTVSNITRKQKDGTKADVLCPDSVALYNRIMGGVDLSYQKGKLVTFLKVRLGWRRQLLILSDPSGRFPYVYRPLSDIKVLLGHAQAQIAVLKIDIENSEWDVFDKSIFQTRVLERTRQLALEVHLDYLYPDSQHDPHPEGRLEGLRQIARVVSGLHERGFRLAYYEPNYNFPVSHTLHGKTFHIYFETVWLNTRTWPAVTTQTTPDLNTFDSLPSVEIIHNDV
ncbi:hypothetical protein FHG87_014050 [Trinorchestia longiramus]|nr:hypothetical protein FHG87_014050 [Trinorchestia longiramus]